MLLAEGGAVKAYDPAAVANDRKVQADGVTYCQGPYEAAVGADALAILTEWDEFRNMDLHQLKGLMSRPILVDGRNIFEPQHMADQVGEYYGTGR